MYYYIYETNMYYDRLIYIYIVLQLFFGICSSTLLFVFPSVNDVHTFIDQY